MPAQRYAPAYGAPYSAATLVRQQGCFAGSRRPSATPPMVLFSRISWKRQDILSLAWR